MEAATSSKIPTTKTPTDDKPVSTMNLKDDTTIPVRKIEDSGKPGNPTIKHRSQESIEAIAKTLKSNSKNNNTMEKRHKFCPWCCNMLQVKPATKVKDSWRLKCITCPYMMPIKEKIRYTVHDYRAEQDDDDCQIIETSKADEHRQRTEILCPKCTHKEAFFYQMQTRSADEPMTTFYECCDRSCRYTWRD